MVWILSLAVAAGVARRPFLIACVVAVLVVRAWVRRRDRARLQFLFVAGVCAALGWAAALDLERDCAAVESARAAAGAACITLAGTVVSFPQTDVRGTTFEFATRVGGRSVRLEARGECFDVAYGDNCRLRARFLAPSPVARGFQSSRGLAGSIRVRCADITRDGRGGNIVLRECFWPLHRFARTRLSRALGKDAGLAIGMLLGERSQLAESVRDAIRRLGITHLLAISGMHLTTVAGCVLLATRRRARHRRLALLLALTVYTATVGNVESLTRAYVMAILLLLASATIRPLRPMDTLAMALLAMAVASPLCLRSVGLQLSFAATFVVLLWLKLELWRARAHGPRALRWLRAALRSVASAFIMSVAVEVFIAPLQLHHFHALSIAAPIATVIFFVPVTLVMLASVPVIALSALLPAQAWPGAALGALCAATTRVILASGHALPQPLALPEPDPWVYYAGLCVGWRFRRHPAAWALCAAMVAAAFVWRARTGWW